MNKKTVDTLVLMAIAVASPSFASAGASEWHEATGARIRILAESPPDQGGDMRAALQIQLEDGWKTYWRDPGFSGIPPSVEFNGANGALASRMDFPPPRWIDDEDDMFAGYTSNVTFPITIAADGRQGPLKASVFLGVCETICVPVRAELTIDPSAATGPLDLAPLTQAFAARPSPATAQFGVVAAHRAEDGTIGFEVALPDDADDEASLFLAGDGKLSLSPPERTEGKHFEVHVQRGEPGASMSFEYTLAAGDEAVSGVIVVP